MTTAQTTRRWVLGLAAVASFMVALDTLVVSTALSTIRQDLGASIEQLEWTVNAYKLRFPLLLVKAAAAGCALAPDVGALIVARAVQGAGAAFVLPLSLTLVGAAYPPERRGAAMGA